MIWDNLPKPFLVLAPMDDVTDSVFRQVVANCGAPDLFFTEFVNVDGLQSPGRGKLLKKLQFTSVERPIIAQIWGKDPDNYLKTAQELVEMGFDGVDINMGCPDKTVVKNGCCIALSLNRPLAKEIIEATRDGLGGKLPLSVKTRLGVNEVDLSWPQFLLEQKLDALTMHGRTAKQLSDVPADWGLIAKVRQMRDQQAPNTKIIGNGDVLSRKQAEQLVKTHQLDGVMIGRGVFHDPFVFSTKSPWEDFAPEQKIELYKEHVELFTDTWLKGEHKIHTLNKFCKIYINGFAGAKELREQLMQSEDAKELIKNLTAIKS